MARPRSDDRSGASSHSGADAPDLAALKRELYRPGADRSAVEAYLAAAGAAAPPGGEEDDPRRDGLAPATDAPLQPRSDAEPAGRSRPPWRHVALAAALAVAVPTAGIAILPRQQPAPSPSPSPRSTGPPVAPATFDGLRGGSTLLVALPFRTSRVRIRLECAGRRAAYGWTALGQDFQSQVFVPVLRHAGTNCSPGATYVGPLPGDITTLRILVTVDGPYALSVEPL